MYVGHQYGITVNADDVIGRNCNIHKGVTIGQENRGKRKGVPSIGNEVWIGVNATIVDKVSIGEDVLIAPNALLIVIFLLTVLFLAIRELLSIEIMRLRVILITRFNINLCGTLTD